MCYTQEVYLTQEQIQQIEGKYSTPFNGDRYVPYHAVSAFAHPELPIIREYNGEYQIEFMKWGLIPSWCQTWDKAQELWNFTPNAKAETITEKPSFKNAVSSNRCLVLSNGFYEWQTRGKDKIPHYIYLNNREFFCFAGIYDSWENPDTEEVFQTFSIVTTEANAMMSDIHNTKKRMPVILPEALEKRWINNSLGVDSAVKLLQPYNEEFMSAHTISRLITSRDRDYNVPEVKEHFAYGLFG